MKNNVLRLIALSLTLSGAGLVAMDREYHDQQQVEELVRTDMGVVCGQIEEVQDPNDRFNQKVYGLKLRGEAYPQQDEQARVRFVLSYRPANKTYSLFIDKGEGNNDGVDAAFEGLQVDYQIQWETLFAGKLGARTLFVTPCLATFYTHEQAKSIAYKKSEQAGRLIEVKLSAPMTTEEWFDRLQREFEMLRMSEEFIPCDVSRTYEKSVEMRKAVVAKNDEQQHFFANRLEFTKSGGDHNGKWTPVARTENFLLTQGDFSVLPEQIKLLLSDASVATLIARLERGLDSAQ